MPSEAGNCCRRKPAGSVFELGRASFECDGDKSAGENDLLREENTRPREHTVLRRDAEAGRTVEHRLSTHHAGSLDMVWSMTTEAIVLDRRGALEAEERPECGVCQQAVRVCHAEP